MKWTPFWEHPDLCVSRQHVLKELFDDEEELEAV